MRFAVPTSIKEEHDELHAELQAKRDWKEGRFPKVPGDEQEFIALPD